MCSTYTKLGWIHGQEIYRAEVYKVLKGAPALHTARILNLADCCK
jgi:hypothetical protein